MPSDRTSQPMESGDQRAVLGSLCTGIGGLDLATERHFGAELGWYAEVEPAPCTVLEREYPGVPNLGDLTTLDWSAVPPVDILTAGYPCQPFSHAGKRKGQHDERHLWPYIAEAVRVLRPRWVVLENVAGHLTLGFGDVLRDLAEAGFDAEWCLLRASDVGAPHRRERVFVVATDARRTGAGWDGRAVQGATEQARRQEFDLRSPRDGCDRAAAHADGQGLQGHGRPDGDDREVPERHVPAAGAVPVVSDADGERLKERAQHDGRPATGWIAERDDRDDAQRLGLAAIAWGAYEPAIRRWERTFGRPAPRPLDERGRLNPPFVEWMMGYPEGWTAGMKRTAALKALGNAVVPQQALAALSVLAPEMAAAA